MKKVSRFILFFWIATHLFSCRTVFIQQPFCVSLINYIPAIKQSVYDPVTRTLKISWDSISCANQYQLEWTFADSDDSSTLNQSWKPDFRFNSTRIVTRATHYGIPIIYEEGTLIYRLRCVKMNDSSGQALFSSWSRVFVAGQNAGLANLFLPARFQINSALAHEDHKLNWQYSTKYSDEGGRKDNVQYLDGTLRQRQVVTVSNSDTLALAMNTIYDNDGRAAIHTLPVPVIYADSLRPDNQYAHHLGYFPKQVLVAKDTIFTYRQFDLDRFSVKSDSCSPVILKPRPLSTESGASRYFSTNNMDKAGFQAFVPDAGGFPYVQTQWTDDNTDRIIRQSGPGQTHFIGSNHEFSFRYADVAQDEIDMLFGNDAGDESYYKKTIKTDPNGQMSVEYTRIDGKVIATALAGPIPDNLDSITSQVVPINVDIVGNEQTAGADGLSKFSTKTFDLSINTACAFGYRLLPRNFEKNLCNNEKVCLDCKYKVQLLLRDQNGTVLHQIDTAIGTLLQNCTTGNAPVYRNLFTKILCKGNYTITRTLTIDTSGFENYYRTYLGKADSCGDQSVIFPVPEKITSTCSLTCDDCKAIPDSLKAGLKEYCDFICNKGFASPCDQSKAMMLINLSPGGQYAQYDKVLGNVDASKYPLSIYYNGKWRTITTPAPAGLKLYLTNNDLNGLVNNWKTEWAEYFLPLHPEYCYYIFCVDYEKAYIQSKQFNDKMLEIPNAQKAVTSVYIDPLNNDPSLNIFGIAADVKARLNNFRNGKNIKEFIYSGFLNCKSVPPYNNNFANTPDTFANNMQWQMFRALYMSIKNQVIDSLREVYVKNKCGGFCNKCIGDSLNHYSSCNPPNCNIPVDSTCNSLKKKLRLFPSSFNYQELLPFKLTGIDTLDLAIIQNYTANHLPKNCRCGKYDQVESLFRYVIGKKKFEGSIFIPDTLCSVGIAYETIPGYRGDLRWVGTVQAGGSFDVTLYDTLKKKRCTMNFITTDSLIPWRKIVLVSCLRTNRLPAQFPAGPNIFLVDLYDSTYKKFTAEAKISCIDTGSCKPAKTCTPVCDENGLVEIFNCGFANGNATTIDLKDSLVRKWLECTYNTKLTRGKLSWKAVRSGDQYIVTLIINAEINGIKKERLVDSCQYIFDFGKNIIYTGSKMEVISIEPDRTDTKDTCTIYGIRMILKIQVENLPPRYITVYGRPGKNCFPIAECCKVVPPKKCPNEFSNKLSAFSSINTDTVNAQLGIADTIWAKKFSLNNPGYYYFSFNASVIIKRGVPPSSINNTILSQLIELRIDDSVYTQNLLTQYKGNFVYTISGRIPFRYKRSHKLQVELKPGNRIIQQIRIRAYDFSLVGENCDDCCLPVFPPFGTPGPAECDSTEKIVDGYNGEIIRTQYLAALRAKLKLEFMQHCLSNIDSFGLKYSDALYHFTLYYYDQANNLVTTVPPKGVRLLSADSVQKAQTHRRNATAPEIYPAHSFKTDYRFNSINNVTEATTPDAGTARNWYDPLGRLVIRQEARQSAAGKYNYTLYDRLSRIIQSGEFVGPGVNIPSLIRDSILFANTLRSSERYDVNTTIYDQPFIDSINGLTSVFRNKNKFFGDSLNYLRHRVAASFYNDTIPAGSNLVMMNYQHAIHYWYDMHGFVRMLVHEIPALKSFAQNLKREAYDYELLSGQVKKAKYQQGEPDQFFTRYVSDADNRLIAVFTSLNDTIWERDARYYFNKHQMLARMEIGEDGVQGLDYVYTIQGLLKSINSFTLHTGTDPGMDGDSTGTRRSSAVDMFGYEIGYFKDDYKAINTLPVAPGIHSAIYDSLRISNGLYDGNMRYVVKSLGVPALSDKIQASIYSYDQVNRLTSSSINPITIKTGYFPEASLSADYGTKLRYDANGNILAMMRNGAAAAGQRAMDALTFHYNSLNNQLQFITDTVNSNNYSNDVDGSQPGNYKYDLSGNLTKDVSENIDSILWNSRGKIAKIIKDGGASSIDYTYSSLGNRLSVSSKGKTTYYITDIDGNTLATYIKDTSGLHCKELAIYGSKRLGTFNKGLNANNTVFVKGNKQYELNDHLGNVLLTISDKKIPQDTDGDGIANYYTAEVVSAADYYPFGMQMPLRTVNDTTYRYGFNGKEKDDDVKGKGNQLDFGSRIYDSRLGRFLSIDPAAGAYPYLSPYLSSGNNPILYIDKYGEGPAEPPPHIAKAMRENHPIAYKALLASNNTSPREFYLWVKTGKGNFKAFKGAFGEAEEYRRIEEGESHFHGNSSRGSIGYGSGGSPELGKKYEGYQVDVQETLASADIINLTGVITVRGYVDIHSSNINGRDNRRVFYGENEDVTFTLNYEVKNLSPLRSPESAIEYIEKGVDQAVDRTSKKDNAIGILVTDKQSWMNIYKREDLRPRLEAAYKKLTDAGAYLQLEEDLSLKSEDELWRTWDSVKEAIGKEKSDEKKE